MSIYNDEFNMETVVFGGGCFWCTEAVFKMLKGIKSVEPGYSGGQMEHPIYQEVLSGKTGHAEVVEVVYDPNKISFNDLLTVFFATHNPTTLNKQGRDIGTQYRSVIFYTTEQQRHQARKFIEELNRSNSKGKKIVTSIEPLGNFYEAEQEHKNYYRNHSDSRFCQLVINPKLNKVKEKFANLLNKL